ncbi:hypothetical protein FGO68_gene7240 [Halteria grandinella]|uniref:Uncharacterized protein n=1 Tax=Halteria grandinella TaxID=5974 RepID=A0A8J8NNN8_HALGN|nr:hypothetical protein FGO68_gene7240 [Halteria grandinella]
MGEDRGGYIFVKVNSSEPKVTWQAQKRVFYKQDLQKFSDLNFKKILLFQNKQVTKLRICARIQSWLRWLSSSQFQAPLQ